MSESTNVASANPIRMAGADPRPLYQARATCDECQGSGGWYRYEPALDPAPGLLYLSCLHCRGTGRTAEARG